MYVSVPLPLSLMVSQEGVSLCEFRWLQAQKAQAACALQVAHPSVHTHMSRGVQKKKKNPRFVCAITHGLYVQKPRFVCAITHALSVQKSWVEVCKNKVWLTPGEEMCK